MIPDYADLFNQIKSSKFYSLVPLDTVSLTQEHILWHWNRMIIIIFLVVYWFQTQRKDTIDGDQWTELDKKLPLEASFSTLKNIMTKQRDRLIVLKLTMPATSIFFNQKYNWVTVPVSFKMFLSQSNLCQDLRNPESGWSIGEML